MTSIFAHEETEADRNRRWYEKPKNWIRLFYISLIIAIIIIGISLYSEIGEFLITYLEWMRNNLVVGSLAYLGIHIIWVTVALPATYLVLGAGFVYAHILPFWEGVFVASLLSLIGSCIGCIFAFLNGRYVLRQCIVSSFGRSRKWAVVEHMAEEHGIKFSLLLRFNFIPTSMANYGSSVTKLKFIQFIIGLFGLIPDLFVHSLVGADFARLKDLLKGSMTKSEMPLFIGGIVVMLIALLLSIGLVYYAKRQVDKMMAEQEAQDSLTNDWQECDGEGGPRRRMEGVVVVDDDDSDSIGNMDNNGSSSSSSSSSNSSGAAGIKVSETAPLLA